MVLQVEPYRVACPNHVDSVPGVDPDSYSLAYESEGWDEEEEEEGEGGPGGSSADMLRQ